MIKGIACKSQIMSSSLETRVDMRVHHRAINALPETAPWPLAPGSWSLSTAAAAQAFLTLVSRIPFVSRRNSCSACSFSTRISVSTSRCMVCNGRIVLVKSIRLCERLVLSRRAIPIARCKNAVVRSARGRVGRRSSRLISKTRRQTFDTLI